ncbi:stability determinant [Burkholderia vietnamiensis]|nr:stability determinant [Burkholderia vietnamiensis]HDR8993910.1 stability determinant [Burkholderia vietnamiensis]
MTTALSPIESEFATVEEAEAYDRWFRAKVQASLADTRPTIPHDQVMADMEAIIQAAERKRAAIRS